MNVNSATIGGNIVRDPELRATKSGKSVTNFTVAVNNSYGEREDTAFIKITAWGKTAENVAEYKQKGDPVIVEGRITQEQWEMDDGTKREKTGVTAYRVHFIGGGKSETGPEIKIEAEPEPESNVPF